MDPHDHHDDRPRGHRDAWPGRSGEDATPTRREGPPGGPPGGPPFPTPPPPSRRRFFLGLALLALAIAAVIAVAVGNRGADWQVALLGQARVVLDGGQLPDQQEDLAGLLARGGQIRTPPRAGVAITAARTMALELAPDSELELSAPVGRWFDRTTGANLRHGRLLIRTGERFDGAAFEVYTAGGMVRVLDGVVAVERDSVGTRVCVLEGDAVAGLNHDELNPVLAGHCLHLFGRDRDQDLTTLTRSQTVALNRFVRRSGPRLGGD